MANIGAQLETGEQEAVLAFLTERHGLVNVLNPNRPDSSVSGSRRSSSFELMHDFANAMSRAGRARRNEVEFAIIVVYVKGSRTATPVGW
jgi:hypothetical protein